MMYILHFLKGRINSPAIDFEQPAPSIAGEFIHPSHISIAGEFIHPPHISIAGEFIHPSKTVLKFIFIMSLIFAFILRGSSQTREKIITKNFKFENGIYATFTDWQRNKPTYRWDSIETTFAVNPTTFLMQMEALRLKKSAKMVEIDSIWGVVVDGIPYMRLPKKEISKPIACFAGFVLRGAICYFQYETMLQTKVPITAYIPETGEAFMTRNVSNKTPVIKEKLMRYETGEILELNLNNFKQLIADDKDLLTTVNDLKPNEIKEKLFKCILIYNDRNPVFLK